MAPLVTLSIVVLNIIPSLSIVPNCDTITILCPGNDPSCCQGSCCQLLHQFSTPPLNPTHPRNPRILTNSDIDPIPIEIDPNLSQQTVIQNLPQLNQECTSRFARPFQCDQGLKCKFSGEYDTNLYLLGECKVTPQQNGCKFDSDCYKFNNECINGRCSDPIIFSRPRIEIPESPGDANGNGIGDGIVDAIGNNNNNGNGPLFEARSVSGNLAEQNGEIEGGNRNIPFNLSKQAQLIIGVLALMCALCACFKCCSIFCKLRRRRNKRSSDSSYQSGSRTDTAVDADVEWSDNTDDEEKGKSKDPENLLKDDKDKDKDQNKKKGKGQYADFTDNDLL